MKSRFAITINRKRYLSAVFEVPPAHKEFTKQDVRRILGQDFSTWVAVSRFPEDARWDIKVVPDDSPDYEIV